MNQNVLVKPREKTKQLKKRILRVKKGLPHNWPVLFIHDHKEYKGQNVFLNNLIMCRSMHEPTIIKLEEWAVANGYLKTKNNPVKGPDQLEGE